ncbi:ATP-dependent RNA helicase DDX42-like [Ylistrum balloti]|uniref:ATP-dependent RNA helicase DDX42-like n=1 Tax=Ylistrum balloti TaxID=509963 RepID=UPI002905E995|nr:ATP-dependent RNA helicase DDX42-like [Ylistrum balloti]
MFHKGGDGKPRGFGFSGFALGNKKADEPDPSKPVSGMAGMPSNAGGRFMPGRSFGYSTNIGKRRARNEDEYFDDDDEEGDLEYQPAPGSPSADDKNKDGSDSDDPLDAFMADIEKEVKGKMKESKEHKEKSKEKKKDKGVRDDIENEDVQEAFFRYMEENPMAGVILDEDEAGIEYDADGNPIIPEKNKMIDPLPPIDHTEIDYQKFVKNFYQEHEDIAKLTQTQVDELRHKLGIRVSGFSPSNPATSFAHFGFDNELMGVIRKSEYSQPTPIQAQGVPTILNGRDIIGIAKTGSGKTATYLWPLLVHIMDQKELETGDGPIGLILAPTRELSQQIYHEAKKFGKVYNINVVCAYGGGNMWEQTKACQEGAEIIVATPGRLIDLVKKKATNLQRVTYLVFDEADRMFDMGFEPQVRSIANHVRKDRQTLLFSATFKKKVERLARDILLDPVRVVQGEAGEANEDVTQYVEVLPAGPAKWTWLIKNLVRFTSIGSVLIFVTRKSNSEELATNLRTRDFSLGLLHGDMGQMERNEIITAFKRKEMPILVATDVAARGLDIPYIRTVVNYDVARDIDTHTHRIGRTGRAGEKGYAYTLLTEKDKDFAGPLVRNMEVANQFVPKSLMDLALQNPWFSKSRFKQGKGKRLNVGGKGLGFKERPGLGAESSTRTQDSSSMASFRGVGSSAGPQSDRMSAMKQAFSAQFKSNFVAAADNIEPQKTGHILEPINATRNPAQPQAASDEPNSKRKKRSRWD